MAREAERPVLAGHLGVVHVRPLRDGETAVLSAIFASMSSRSRYLRFHTGLPHLSDAQLRWLADIDGDQRMAVVAELHDGATRLPIGAARLVRTSRTTAEVAVSVVDSWHRRGVATRMLGELCAAAARSGIQGLEAVVLGDNAAAIALHRSFTADGSLLTSGVQVALTFE